jgi:spoIIIJ-associated protein
METERIVQEIKALLAVMGFGEQVREVTVHQGATTRISVWLRDADLPSVENGDGRVSVTSVLIGERGNNLGAIEHIVKKIVRKKYEEEYKFTLDINDYRMRRLDDLKQDVKVAAKEVRLYGKEVPLRPMSSFERRIVHLLLAEYPDIATESIGREPSRLVVIKPYS